VHGDSRKSAGAAVDKTIGSSPLRHILPDLSVYSDTSGGRVRPHQADRVFLDLDAVTAERSNDAPEQDQPSRVASE